MHSEGGYSFLRNKEEEEEKEQQNELRPFYHIEQVLTKRVQHFYLSTVISEPGYYVEMIHRIKSAPPDDIIHIHLNTPGGNLDTGVQIINAIQSTPAHVVCSVEAESHSLGTLIFLSADEFVVHDNTMMMFHNFSGATFGKGHEQQSSLEATSKWFEGLARKLYIPFLSEEEFERIKRGEDIYLHADSIRKRLEKMVKQLEKEQRAREAEAEAKARKTTRTRKKAAS